MADILDKISKESKILEAEVTALDSWRKLKHTKNDLELFLTCNIAQIQFQNKAGKMEDIYCTSSTTLIKIFSAKKPADKKKLVHFKSPVIHSKDPHTVLTWDLKENKYKTISIKKWYIINFLSITPENVLVLDELINKLLK